MASRRGRRVPARLHAEGPGDPAGRRPGRKGVRLGSGRRGPPRVVREGLLRGPRRAQERVGRGDQEGVPQARAAASTPTRTRATRTPRSGSRRSPPPTTCWRRGEARALRPGARDGRRGFGAGGPGGRVRGGLARRSGWRALRDRRRRRPRRPVRRDVRRRRAAAAARPAAAAARRRPGDRGRLSFDDAMAGTTVPVTLTGPRRVTPATARAPRPGTSPVTCPTCGGSGAVSVNQGFFQMAQTCPVPRERADRRDPCPTCRGTGAERRTRTFKVKIPAGVKDGARIRLAGAGSRDRRAGSRATCTCGCASAQHAVFGRKGDDLTLELPVSYPGGRARAPTCRCRRSTGR